LSPFCLISSLFSRIDPEVAWYEDHIGRFSSSDSLGDLVGKSEEAESRWKNLTQILAYDTLFIIADGRLIDFRKRQEKILTDMRKKVEEIKQNGDKETTIIERWFSDIEIRFTQSRSKEDEAKEEIKDLDSRRRNNAGIYSGVIKTLEEAHGFVKEANGFLKEIIREIKTAD